MSNASSIIPSRPGDIVSTICQIYINLEQCPEFIGAISQDGRSYSADLFQQAVEVLAKIYKYDLISTFQDLDRKVRAAADLQTEEDSLFADAPDHFLDPIMSILMKDPVKTGSSLLLFTIITTNFE